MPGYPMACYGVPCVKHPQQQYAYIKICGITDPPNGCGHVPPVDPCGAGPCSGDNCGDCETVDGVYTLESLWDFCKLDFVNPAGEWEASNLVICDTESAWMEFTIECNEPSPGWVKATFTMNLGTGTELIITKTLNPSFCSDPDSCVTPESFGTMDNIIATPTQPETDCQWSQVYIEVTDDAPP